MDETSGSKGVHARAAVAFVVTAGYCYFCCKEQTCYLCTALYVFFMLSFDSCFGLCVPLLLLKHVLVLRPLRRDQSSRESPPSITGLRVNTVLSIRCSLARTSKRKRANSTPCNPAELARGDERWSPQQLAK